MKYFFLSEGWTISRVWGTQGLWNVTAWRRQPDIQRLSLCIVERDERLWLHQVENAVLMVEVRPQADINGSTIGHVVLKRLMNAEQVIDRLCTSFATCQLGHFETERSLN
ncbi:hypothetical protein AY599_23180 [Leptolyngbya valderiana BDU 20041]|uniref:hypothetical protein n=1 Tax=Baaleninema simplex TaxID=2862350 RepID=UPI00034B1B10|nr:hypothetical protein [Baaleninema simplex]MDC0833652.1 hypothetical protein [Geitlerinema sp. CS-897]OAB63323.1 hypothetical protein AY599_23180 [Leptolyngbya valderiana BDU 20041]PPT09876.1 hypothetical protein CKA32_004376 [Geitlerinema sp. FC II]